jgi:hypothetical protein
LRFIGPVMVRSRRECFGTSATQSNVEPFSAAGLRNLGYSKSAPELIRRGKRAEFASFSVPTVYKAVLV